jgi:hypothetical protein
VFDKFDEKDITKLIEVLQPFVANMTIQPDGEDTWFKDVISMAVKRFTGMEIKKEETKKDNTVIGPNEDTREAGKTRDIESTLKQIVPAPIEES